MATITTTVQTPDSNTVGELILAFDDEVHKGVRLLAHDITAKRDTD